MIITKEGEEFQTLLKKVEYLEDVIRNYKYYSGCDPYKRFGDCAIKRGAWVRGRYSKLPYKFGRCDTDGRIYDTKGYLRKDKVDDLEIMTNPEIKDYLIKEAKERGLADCCKFRWSNEDGITTMSPRRGYEYIETIDALTVGIIEESSRRAIYMDDNWAEPILITELPKTVSELGKVLKDFGEEIYGSDLLCMIGGDEEKFLKKHNYK